MNWRYANNSEDYPDVPLLFTGYSARCSWTGVMGESNGDFVNEVASKLKIGFEPTICPSESKG